MFASAREEHCVLRAATTGPEPGEGSTVTLHDRGGLTDLGYDAMKTVRASAARLRMLASVCWLVIGSSGKGSSVAPSPVGRSQRPRICE